MITNRPFRIAAQVALALGLCALLYFGKIDWTQLLVGLGFLQVPSLFHQGAPKAKGEVSK